MENPASPRPHSAGPTLVEAAAPKPPPAAGLVRMLGISGSLRGQSYNRALLGAAAAELPLGADLAFYHGLAEIPAYNEDRDTSSMPAPVTDLRAAITGADALLIATPEYNGSLPGALKNALDWATRPWQSHCLKGKPVLVIGASTGPFGALWAQAELRKVLRISGAHVLDRELLIGPAADAFDDQGRLRDRALQARLADAMTALVAYASSPLSAPR